MNDKNIRVNTVTLAYFSGTGCTEKIVDCFENQFVTLGIKVNRINIGAGNTGAVEETDLLMIFSPVYAFRLASPVEAWIKNVPEVNNTPAAIVSVSGGGEVSPNTACRVSCKRLLKRKGYDVIYEKMMVMPSNFAAQTEEQLAFRLINIIPQKTQQIIQDILSGKKNITHPKLQDRIYASIGKMEHLGARFFGWSICVSKECNQCGLCMTQCPAKNIQMKNGLPEFGFQCIWCLKCIYACPQKALSPKLLKFVVLKDGFDLEAMSQMAYAYKPDVKLQSTEDSLWKGVMDYLKEREF